MIPVILDITVRRWMSTTSWILAILGLDNSSGVSASTMWTRILVYLPRIMMCRMAASEEKVTSPVNPAKSQGSVLYLWIFAPVPWMNSSTHARPATVAVHPRSMMASL